MEDSSLFQDKYIFRSARPFSNEQNIVISNLWLSKMVFGSLETWQGITVVSCDINEDIIQL